MTSERIGMLSAPGLLRRGGQTMPPTRKTETKKPATPAAQPVKKTIGRRRPKVTHEMIEHRAYLISQSEHAGSPFENWISAERELSGQ
jgi:hypothetical protein